MIGVMTEKFCNLFMYELWDRMLELNVDPLRVLMSSTALRWELLHGLKLITKELPISILLLGNLKWEILAFNQYSFDVAPYVEYHMDAFGLPVNVICTSNLVYEVMEKYNLTQDDVWKEVENV